MYGTIYKLFNVKLAYLTAVFIFEIGSLISAVAPSSTAFIVGRAIAGVSGKKDPCHQSFNTDNSHLDWHSRYLLRLHCYSFPNQ